MKCGTLLIFSLDITTAVVPYLYTYILIVGVTNIIGNAFLIWALKKTGQTKTISCQLIIMMSISDLISSANNLILLIITTFRQYETRCWFRLFSQCLQRTCNGFSFILIALIALDRYLHMRYLERYPSVVTKKRAYIMAIALCLLLSVINIIFVLPFPYNISDVSNAVYLFSTFPIIFSVFIMYYRAMKAIRTKASQLTRSVITTTRTLSKAAKRITLCVVVLTLPMIITQMLELANRQHKFIRYTSLDNIRLFAYISFTSIAFWSSYIFISLNTPIRMLLRRFARYSCKRNTSTIGSTDKRT